MNKQNKNNFDQPAVCLPRAAHGCQSKQLWLAAGWGWPAWHALDGNPSPLALMVDTHCPGSDFHGILQVHQLAPASQDPSSSPVLDGHPLHQSGESLAGLGSSSDLSPRSRTLHMSGHAVNRLVQVLYCHPLERWHGPTKSYSYSKWASPPDITHKS